MELFVETGWDQKRIAEFLKVSERTISEWARTGEWKKIRANRNVTPQELENNLIEIINETLQSIRQTKEAKERSRLSDELSKYNKTWEKIKNENKISLSQHIQVCRDILVYTERYKPQHMPTLVDLIDLFIKDKSKQYL